jgi:predicted nucleic-acid-binding Zn-ribbon protein
MAQTFANLMDNGQRIALYCPQCGDANYIEPAIVAVHQDLQLCQWNAGLVCASCRNNQALRVSLKVRAEGH